MTVGSFGAETRGIKARLALIRTLERLRQGGGHDHLMTRSWAGNELTEQKHDLASTLINHLRITVVGG
jgi:hypothetical protein